MSEIEFLSICEQRISIILRHFLKEPSSAKNVLYLGFFFQGAFYHTVQKY